MGLILLWAYIILVAGTVTGLINFRIHVASTSVGVIVLGVWLIQRLSQRKEIALTGIEWGIIAFMAAQFVAVLFSQDIRRSLPSLVIYGVLILVFYYVYDLVRQGWPVELIEKTLLIVGGIVVGLALFQLWGDYSFWKNMLAGLPYAPGFQYRLYAIFGDANLLAAFVDILIPISVGRILISRRLSTSIALGGLLVSVFVVVYFSSSRGGILGDLAAIFVLVVGWMGFASERAREWGQKMWDYLRARPVTLGALVLVVVAPLGLIFWRALQFQGDATHGPLLSSRTTFWGAAWKAFQSSPWVGIGPGTYPSAYIEYNAVPPGRPYLHAHSIPFTLAAESGLLGLAGLLIFVFIVARRIWLARLDLSTEARVRWVAILAALGGFGVHSLVDNHLPYASVGITITVLLAMLIGQNRDGIQRRVVGRPNKIAVLWLLVPALLITGFSIYSLRAYADNEAAVDAALDGDWQRAALAFEQAIKHDPWLAHYWLQGGYAYGVMAAEGDEVYRAALQQAIELTQQGIALEPGYALHYANLAALHWQAGDLDLALSNLNQAIELEPQVPIFWLNLGVYAETLARKDDARRAYNELLELESELAETDFWPRTALRAEVLASWQATHSESTTAVDLVSRGRSAIAMGDYSSAEEILENAWEQDDQNVALYLALSELAHARGNSDQAEGYLHAALWIQKILTNEEKVAPLLALAELDYLRGDTEAALIRFRQVYEALTDYTIYGWGTKGWDPYSWFVFQRRSLPVDILPQMIRPPLPPEMVERLMPLVDLYHAEGETESANEVYQQLTETY